MALFFEGPTFDVLLFLISAAHTKHVHKPERTKVEKSKVRRSNKNHFEKCRQSPYRKTWTLSRAKTCVIEIIMALAALRIIINSKTIMEKTCKNVHDNPQCDACLIHL